MNVKVPSPSFQDEPGPSPFPAPAVLPEWARHLGRPCHLCGCDHFGALYRDGYEALMREHPDWPLHRVRLAAEWHGLPERTRRDHLLHIIGRFSLRLHGPRRPW